MRYILSFLLLLAAPFAQAGEAMQAGLMIHDARIAASTGAARTGAGYFTVMNHSGSDDRLLGAEADFPRVEVHNVVEVNGEMKMVHQEEGIALPAGGFVTLAPGGYHVMFMGLSAPFVAGDQVTVTLVFEHAGRVPVVFDVTPREEITGGSGHGMTDGMSHDMDHSTHDPAQHGDHMSHGN